MGAPGITGQVERDMILVNERDQMGVIIAPDYLNVPLCGHRLSVTYLMSHSLRTYGRDD